MRYAQHLNDFGLPAYPVITTSHNDGPEFDAARDLNQDKIVEDFIDPDGEPQVLVVVDKLITGFDAPVEQVLYLDRSIREHTLLQAIARVNPPVLAHEKRRPDGEAVRPRGRLPRRLAGA